MASLKSMEKLGRVLVTMEGSAYEAIRNKKFL